MLQEILKIIPHHLAAPLTSCDGVPEIDQFFLCHRLYVTKQLSQKTILLFREQPASIPDLLTLC